MCNLNDITHSRPGICSHDAKRSDILGNRLLVLRREHARFLKLTLQALKLFVQESVAVQHDLLRIQLVFAVPLVYIHSTAHDDLLAFRQTKRKTRSVACEHDAVYHSLRVL